MNKYAKREERFESSGLTRREFALKNIILLWLNVMNTLDDGRFELDNNLIENKIRPLAFGRENYLFAGSHAKARRIAMMYSFMGTCIANNVNPSEWLKHTLEKINDTKITNLECLLPNNFQMFCPDGYSEASS